MLDQLLTFALILVAVAYLGWRRLRPRAKGPCNCEGCELPRSLRRVVEEKERRR